jgi:alkylation response protein AidB-like acyl-CoA dehydrogenase
MRARSGHAAEAAMQTYGGLAFAREYDIERKWREVRLYQTAPISTNLILAYIGQGTSSACRALSDQATRLRGAEQSCQNVGLRRAGFPDE